MNKRDLYYSELAEASKAKREENIAAHRVQNERLDHAVKRRMELNPSKSAVIPKVPLDFLAIGDSWFEYPLRNEIPLPFQNSAIVDQSQLGSMGSPPPRILNLALHGQATTAVLSWENQERMISVLKDPAQWLNKKTGLPDAILVSAGGDDLVGDQLAIYVDYGGGGLNLTRFQGVLDSVQASYLDLFAFRDIFAPGIPIVGHCYDYAIPNNVHAICTKSAWLWPSFSFAGYDYDSGLKIVTQMIDGFHAMLSALASDKKNNFSFVDTRKTLHRDATQPNGCAVTPVSHPAEEIHPWYPGFTGLAQKFLATLKSMPGFKGRI